MNLTVKDPTEKVKVKIEAVDEPALGQGAEEDQGDVEAMDADAGAEEIGEEAGIG